VDTKIRKGAFGTLKSTALVLGYDASGVVEAVGSKVQRFKVGDEVMFSGSHLRQGCNAEVVLVDERSTGRKPTSLSHTYAAGLPLVGLTAWEGKTCLQNDEVKPRHRINLIPDFSLPFRPFSLCFKHSPSTWASQCPRYPVTRVF
jgi:NADPH:quinone reductase-like Zn-dependent oxidoreductase